MIVYIFELLCVITAVWLLNVMIELDESLKCYPRIPVLEITKLRLTHNLWTLNEKRGRNNKTDFILYRETQTFFQILTMKSHSRSQEKWQHALDRGQIAKSCHTTYKYRTAIILSIIKTVRSLRAMVRYTTNYYLWYKIVKTKSKYIFTWQVS